MARLRIVPVPGEAAEYLIVFDRLTYEEADSDIFRPTADNRPARCVGIMVVPVDLEVP